MTASKTEDDDRRSPELPQVRTRLPHFAAGGVPVTGPHAEAFARGAQMGYPPVVLHGLQATVQFPTEADCLAHMARLAVLPRYVLPPATTKVPEWLQALPDGADVRLFINGQDTLHTAGMVRQGLLQDMKRWATAEGWLRPNEVAALLAAAGMGQAGAIRAQLERAFDAGALHFWRADTGEEMLPDPPGAGHLMHALWAHDACTTAAAVDKWLKADEASKGRNLPRMPVGPWTRDASRSTKTYPERWEAHLAALADAFPEGVKNLPAYFDGDHAGDPVVKVMREVCMRFGAADEDKARRQADKDRKDLERAGLMGPPSTARKVKKPTSARRRG